MSYSYPIVVVRGNILHLWDGPNLDRKRAYRLLKKRRQENPGKTFFIYCDEHQHNCPANKALAAQLTRLREALQPEQLAEKIAGKMTTLFTDKYVNSLKIAAGIIKQEIAAALGSAQPDAGEGK